MAFHYPRGCLHNYHMSTGHKNESHTLRPPPGGRLEHCTFQALTSRSQADWMNISLKHLQFAECLFPLQEHTTDSTSGKSLLCLEVYPLSNSFFDFSCLRDFSCALPTWPLYLITLELAFDVYTARKDFWEEESWSCQFMSIWQPSYITLWKRTPARKPSADLAVPWYSFFDKTGSGPFYACMAIP